jgi:hypothetical protein
VFDEKQKDGLRQWYRQPKIMDEARKLIKHQDWEDLEELLHMRCLFALGRTKELPDYLKNDDGSALLPSVDPRNNLEAWQDTIEVGWEVVEADLGMSRDQGHHAIAESQKTNWDAFMKSVDERKRTR